MSSVGVAQKVSPNWSQQTMICHSCNCFSIVWGQGNAPLVTYLLSSCYIRLRAVPLQSVESKLGRTGEGEMAERETGEKREEEGLHSLL